MRWIKTVDDALTEARDTDDHCCMQCTNDALTMLADEVERLRERLAEIAGRFPDDSSPSQYIDGWRQALHYMRHGELPDDWPPHREEVGHG